MNRAAVQLLLLLCLLLPALPAAAGQTCEEHPITAAQLDQALNLAQAVRTRLPAEGPAVAVLARAGSDVSAYGLRWTHAGLAFRVQREDSWRVLHKLNSCGRDTSDLYRQGLANFFLDDPYELRARLLVPTPAMQERLLAALSSGFDQDLHQPRYSMIAYPFALDYQNSNQWLLELIAAAAEGTSPVSRAQAQRWLKRSGYRPGRIKVGAWQRLGATVFRANVAFTDHPLAERLNGRYRTVTVESLETYLNEGGWLASAEEIRLPPLAGADH